jgi:UDP-N-acetylglucosamine:LPS N-acetylglucosamine transferase
MDLAALKKRSILVPTPGQTEQEYLAKHLMKNNFALCIEQNKFRLKNALELAEQFNYSIQNFHVSNNLEEALNDFIKRIEQLYYSNL